MKIIYAKHFPPKGYKAITLGPVIIIRKGCSFDTVDLNHEKIHWEQYKEMLIIFFWIWYLLEFIFRLITLRNWHRAYRNISFEAESYNNEFNLDYIKGRKHFSWLRYL